MIRFSLIGFFLFTGACATTQMAGDYRAPAMDVNASVQTSVSAIQMHAEQNGWQILEANPEIGIFEAVARSYREDGQYFRERWSFFVSASQVKVWHYREASATPGVTALWTRVYDTPAEYDYKQERSQLASIAQFLGSSALASYR